MIPCIVYKKLSQECSCAISYQSDRASGADIAACIEKDFIIEPMQRVCVPTGIALQIPDGMEGQVRPRSGLATMHGITVLNAPGTIDADYRGEVAVVLINLGSSPYTICHGDRIAQITFMEISRGSFRQAEVLSSSLRAAGGFGSTGI